MPTLQFFLLGSPKLEIDGEPLHLGLRKADALLIYLAVSRKAHHRDVLAALLWPDAPQRTARGSLRRALYRVNQALGEAEVVTEGENLQFNPRADLWLDVDVFRKIAADFLPAGRTAAALSEQPPESFPDLADTIDHLEQAAALYRDDFLSGFGLPDAPSFDEWVFYETDNLRQLFSRLLALQSAAYQQAGNLPLAIQAARRWLKQDQLHEPAHRRLMQLYALSGQSAAALRQYESCARLLKENFDLQPETETQALYQAIQSRRYPALESPLPTSQERSPTPHKLPKHQVPPIDYVRSGDVHIAYQVIGSGPPDVLLIGGFVSHLEQMWYEPGLADFFQQLSEYARLILFDKRGVGLSDRVGYPPTLDHTMEDVQAVMQAVGSHQAVIMGVSEGGPAALLFAASHPDRVSGLILYGTMPRFTRAPDYPWAMRPQQWENWLSYLQENWGGPVSLESFAPSRAHDPALRKWWATLLRSASSPGGVRMVIDVARSIDVRPALPSINAPALVLHRTDDRMIFVGGGRYMAEALPDARFVEQPGQDHWWWIGDASGLLVEIEHFLGTLQAPQLFSKVLATILAMQPSNSSDLKACQELFDQEVQLMRGRVWQPDQLPMLAAFDGASRAIACARGLHSLTRTRGMQVQIGLHTGECELSGDQVQGQAVTTARKVLQAAPAGSILVSAPVKDIVAGAGFTFTPAGELALENNLRLALFSLA